MVGWVFEKIVRFMDDGWLDVWVNGSKYGWMVGWLDGWMVGWLEVNQLQA